MKLEFLEVMLIRTCNLSCQGCTTFSDLKYQGYITWAQGRAWLEPWIKRIELEGIGIMGGEPLINPEIREWLTGLRELMPNTQIRFNTNGLLLEKHWDVVDLLQQLGNTVFKISQHVYTPELEKTIQRVFDSYDWQPVEEYGLKRWQGANQNRFQIAQPKKFLKTFRNDYADMAPHNNDPRAAFDLCIQKRCPMLHNGRLYKCGTVGLTPELLERYGRPNWDQWQPYLVPGLAPDCSDAELEQYIQNFGKPHSLCRQCPTAQDLDSMIDHVSTVVFK
jgi:sulfatase maturation enzyme AslB (radical SAM superfamily)